MSEFDFSEIQAQDILEMRLRRLTGLEREKINAEYQDLIKNIATIQGDPGQSGSLFFRS